MIKPSHRAVDTQVSPSKPSLHSCSASSTILVGFASFVTAEQWHVSDGDVRSMYWVFRYIVHEVEKEMDQQENLLLICALSYRKSHRIIANPNVPSIAML